MIEIDHNININTDFSIHKKNNLSLPFFIIMSVHDKVFITVQLRNFFFFTCLTAQSFTIMGSFEFLQCLRFTINSFCYLSLMYGCDHYSFSATVHFVYNSCFHHHFSFYSYVIS